MKKIFSLSLLIMISYYCSGQSIVVSTNQWSNIMAHEPSGQLYTENIKFTTDTTIDFKTYKVVERTLEKNQLNWTHYGFIREDANKRVFYKIKATSPEKLLYDLTLSLKDSVLAFGVNTINFFPFLDSAKYYVTAIDSLPVGSTYQKQLHLSGNVGGSLMEAAQWVDSMGGMSGILHNWNLMVGEDGYGLLCFEENGALNYQNPYYTSCFVATGVNPLSNPEVTVSVFPDPVADISTVLIKGMHENTAFIARFYNSLGENVLTKNTRNEFQLSKSELPAGIYHFTIQSSGVTVSSGKFVIR
jgi:hypothetical protein